MVKGNVGQKLFLPIKFPEGKFGDEHKKVLEEGLNAIYGIFRDGSFLADLVLCEADREEYLDGIGFF